MDAYRRRGVEQSRVTGLDARDADALGALEAVAATPEEEAVLCACFVPLVGALKPEYAELIELLDLRGEVTEAAAARLGITPNNLKVRRHRARQALPQAAGGDLPGVRRAPLPGLHLPARRHGRCRTRGGVTGAGGCV